MSGYFIAEEGPLVGLIISFEEGQEDLEWSLGRDPDVSDVVLEDPMVSRKHAIVRLTPEGYILENLSPVNPATLNGMMVAESVLMREGDIVQIGSTFFRFSEKTPETSKLVEESSEVSETPQAPTDEPTEAGHAEMSSELHFGPTPDTRWLLKVISGPNSGAEFAMHKTATYLIGKDPNICDIVFQDLSVSRQHARLSINEEENAFIEDLGSRNGVIVNGELISEKQLLSSQDLIALGTTTFLVIDRHEVRETILSPPAQMPKVPGKVDAKEEAAKAKKDWKELIIPKRHLAIAGTFIAVLFTSIFAMLSLFKAEPISIVKVDYRDQIGQALKKFPGITFSFNEPSGKLFLMGHVITTVDHQELLYLLHDIPYIQDIDDNVVVDELVWQSMNALLSRNPDWVGVSLYGPAPGKFVLRGYLNTLKESQSLNDYVNLNFDYLDRLKNEVVVEKVLEIELNSMILERGFTSISYELNNGEIVLAGRIDAKKQSAFQNLVDQFREIPGVRIVKDYVVATTAESSRIDITSDFPVTGYSKSDDRDFFVVIKGRILSQGDQLDGMTITRIKQSAVLLEKAGMHYIIDYNEAGRN